MSRGRAAEDQQDGKEERGEGGEERAKERDRKRARRGSFTAESLLGPPTLHFHLEELRLNDLEGGTAEEIKGEERRGGN